NKKNNGDERGLLRKYLHIGSIRLRLPTCYLLPWGDEFTPVKNIETNVRTTSSLSNTFFFFRPKISCDWMKLKNIPTQARDARLASFFLNMPLSIRLWI